MHQTSLDESRNCGLTDIETQVLKVETLCSPWLMVMAKTHQILEAKFCLKQSYINPSIIWISHKWKQDMYMYLLSVRTEPVDLKTTLIYSQ